MNVKTREQAWEEVNRIFPTDYEKDESSSIRAGYDIYRHPSLNHYCRICDLGCRLEVLIGEYGEEVTNIWIESTSKESDGRERMYEMILDAGYHAYKVCRLARTIDKSIKQAAGNGEVVRVKDVTDDFPISANKVWAAMNDYGFGETEREAIVHLLREHYANPTE
jgi:hypothetical protein